MLGTVVDAGDSTVTKTNILGGKTDNKQTNEETNHKDYNEFCGEKQQGAVVEDNGSERLFQMGWSSGGSEAAG